MSITAIILDDEPGFRAGLRTMVGRRFPDVRIIGEAGTVPEGTDLVLTLRPDLLFLDVEMGTLTGFDLLRRIEPFRPQVIFTTAHEDHAIRAIKFHALDYLLKPIDEEELMQAVVQAMKALRERASDDRIAGLLGSVVSDRQVALPVSDGIEIMHLDDILYCKSDDNYTEVHFREGLGKPLVICRPLKELDELLDGRGFIRIHQSYLVNIKHIKRYHRGLGGELTLTNGRRLPVSKRKKEGLMDALDRLQGKPTHRPKP
ncbi:MAG: response regulator transcription factor [Flavobacteriales bacterium]|nr:response regulator transcription factor [Flavobacteriales bacterium]